MSAPARIIQLVENFERNKESYISTAYNEANTRKEFINPFFMSMGWDMYNEQGYAELYKEVVDEDKIKVGAATKAPDYSFRIGGQRKYFVEAKKPGVNIKDDAAPAYQLRRYAWSAKLPLSILTNFEEFAVYDCRQKPLPTDKASVSRIQYFTYKDYIPKWDEIYSQFSKEGILKGAFDKFAEKKGKGTTEVDAAILQEIEEWRELLAKYIASNNTELDNYALNEVVQKTVDRILFLRICEDRAIENYGQLQSLLNGTNTYARLIQIYHNADTKYNSGLFHFTEEKDRKEPDKISLGLKLDDKPLKEIIRRLYYPESPYEFSIIPVEILGQVYEKFLGKVIRLTAGHHAKIEEKPEVRKAGGVYYTPQYIVDYIVKNTVGEKLKESEKSFNPDNVKLTILDPACGSGSFLLGAYRYLLEWYLQKYSENPAKYLKAKNTPIYQLRENEYNLTITEKKRILTEHLYGVDIDSQAVEVTKLSLMLKTLENESAESIENQMRLFRERALPNLDNNIKCGNSLIGTDFYNDKDLQLFNKEEQRKINCFDWEVEFPEIFKTPKIDIQDSISQKMQKHSKTAIDHLDSANYHIDKFVEYTKELTSIVIKEPVTEYKVESKVNCGFDCVIGNPPYVMAEIDKNEKEYLLRKYSLQQGKPDLYRIFVELSHNIIKSEGYFSFIIPKSILSIPSSQKLRQYLLNKGGLIEIVNFWGQVFDKISINSIILKTQKFSEHSYINLINDKTEKPNKNSLENAITLADKIYKDEILKDEESIIKTDSDKAENLLIKKIESNSNKLSEIANYTLGMQVYHNSIHSKSEINSRVYHSDKKINDSFYYESNGANIQRYNFINNFKEYVSYGDWCYNKPNWEYCSEERILIREIPNKNTLNCCLSNTIHISSKAIIIIIGREINNKILLGILNSKLIGFYVFNSTEKGKQRLFPRISLTTIRNIPIKKLDFSNKTEKAQHDRMVSLVEQMLDAQKEAHSEKNITEKDKQLTQQRIKILDKQIDSLVYELYSLTEEEIKVVEGEG